MNRELILDGPAKKYLIFIFLNQQQQKNKTFLKLFNYCYQQIFVCKFKVLRLIKLTNILIFKIREEMGQNLSSGLKFCIQIFQRYTIVQMF